MPHPSQKIILDEKQKQQLKIMSGLRLPMAQMAAILRISKTCLEDCIKRDESVQQALEEGRGEASYSIRGTLFNRAMGEKDPKTGKYIVEPDMSALRFWCETQEGFKRETKLEIGGTLGVQPMTKQDRLAEIQRLNQITLLTDDSDDDGSE